MERHVDPFSVEDRLDQLVEPARDDVDVPAGLTCVRDELGEAGPDARVLEHPGDDLLERRGHGRELPRDHLAEGKPPYVEPVIYLLLDGRVTEPPRGPT